MTYMNKDFDYAWLGIWSVIGWFADLIHGMIICGVQF